MARNRIAGWDTGRRRSPRLTVERDGRLLGRHPRALKLLDLSASGCLVRCDAPVEPGTILDVELLLDAETVAAKARVSHACLDGAAQDQPARFLAGLSFLGLSAREQAALLRFLDEERRRRRRADAAAR